MSARYHVTLAGKWGGSRTVAVQASSAADARRKGRELAFMNERIMNVYRVAS